MNTNLNLESAKWLVILNGQIVGASASRSAARQIKSELGGIVCGIDSPVALEALKAQDEPETPETETETETETPETETETETEDEPETPETPVDENTTPSEVATGLAAIALTIKALPAKKLTHSTRTAKAQKFRPYTDPERIGQCREFFRVQVNEGIKPCRVIWSILNRMGDLILRKDFIKVGEEIGLHKGTLGQQHYLWSKSHAA